MGRSLDDLGDTLSWWDLVCVLRWHRHDSAVSRLKFPETWWRTIEVDLAALQVDALRGGNWQRGGGQGQNPDPILGPWPTDQEALPAEPAKPKMTATEIRDELAKRRALRESRAG